MSDGVLDYLIISERFLHWSEVAGAHLVMSRNPTHQSELSNLNQNLMTAVGLFADVVSPLSIKFDQHAPAQS